MNISIFYYEFQTSACKTETLDNTLHDFWAPLQHILISQSEASAAISNKLPNDAIGLLKQTQGKSLFKLDYLKYIFTTKGTNSATSLFCTSF